jgi:Na+-transporting NADH:ubiquinone oxidoreductase subunit B
MKNIATKTDIGTVWVRDAISVQRIVWLQYLCVLPALLWACYAVGRQSLRVMAANEIAPADGWRQWVIGSVSTYDHTSAWDSWCYGALYVLPLFTVVSAVAWVWEQVFARWRRRALHPEYALLALLLVLLCPAALPLPWAALGVVLMMLVREVSGGAGNYRVQPVAAGFLLLVAGLFWRGGVSVLPFEGSVYVTLLEVAQTEGFAEIDQYFSWWDAWWGMPARIGGAASLLLAIGGSVVLACGIRPWRLAAGALCGLMGAVIALDGWLGGRAIASLPWYWHLNLGNTALAVFFLVADPTTAPATHAGHWIVGIAIGITAALLRLFTAMGEESFLIAIVLGNSLTVVVDGLSIRRAIRQRRSRSVAARPLDPLRR